MASRAMDVRARHLRLVRPTDRTPAQIAASQSRVVLLLIGSTAALTAIGLIMVLSASSVSADAKTSAEGVAGTIATRGGKTVTGAGHEAIPMAPVGGLVDVLLEMRPGVGTTPITLGAVGVLVFAARARMSHLAMAAYAGGVAGF